MALSVFLGGSRDRTSIQTHVQYIQTEKKSSSRCLAALEKLQKTDKQCTLEVQRFVYLPWMVLCVVVGKGWVLRIESMRLEQSWKSWKRVFERKAGVHWNYDLSEKNLPVRNLVTFSPHAFSEPKIRDVTRCNKNTLFEHCILSMS